MRGRPISIREEDILDAARDVFLERGHEATTSEIAERAGVSESIIFYRYKTKEALFVAVVDRQIALPPIVEQLAALVGTGEIADHLFEVGTSIIAAMQTVLPLMMMAWCSPTKLNVMCNRMKGPNPVRVQMIRLLASYFEGEARRGRIRTVDPEILARAFLGSIADFVMTQYMHHTEDSLPIASPTFLRGLINLILDGARARESRAAALPKRRRVAQKRTRR